MEWERSGNGRHSTDQHATVRAVRLDARARGPVSMRGMENRQTTSHFDHLPLFRRSSSAVCARIENERSENAVKQTAALNSPLVIQNDDNRHHAYHVV